MLAQIFYALQCWHLWGILSEGLSLSQGNFSLGDYVVDDFVTGDSVIGGHRTPAQQAYQLNKGA